MDPYPPYFVIYLAFWPRGDLWGVYFYEYFHVHTNSPRRTPSIDRQRGHSLQFLYRPQKQSAAIHKGRPVVYTHAHRTL